MKRVLFLIVVISFIYSCTHVISKPVRMGARTDVPFSNIKAETDKYKGTTFILGGIIVSTKNTEEGSIIEAVQTPVDRYGSIIDSDISSGRFLAIERGHLDPLIYKKGREITIAGELVGSRKKKAGEIEYAYPFFEIKEIYLWKEDKGYYYNLPPYPYPYPPYNYRYPYWWYDPWLYGPYYHPYHP